MKNTILLAVAVLSLNGAASAQTQAAATKKVPCEDCGRFPYKPIGCDNTVCLEQLLSTITRQQMMDFFSLPSNIIDKVIFTRNRGVKGMQDYQAALEPAEYQTLLNAYDHYVFLRLPK